jgi:hypothetical protein
VVIPAEYALRPLGNTLNRSQPAWRSATLASEKGPHVRQDGIAHVEYHLKWLESKYADGETPGKPFGAGQISQDLSNGFSAELHRAIRHEEMDRLIGIPDVEVRMERQQRVRIVANRLYDEARPARTDLRRPLHPMPDAAADSAFVIE